VKKSFTKGLDNTLRRRRSAAAMLFIHAACWNTKESMVLPPPRRDADQYGSDRTADGAFIAHQVTRHLGKS